MAQNDTRSILTPKQRKVAEMLVDPGFTGTITELCGQLGVPRRTFYRWRDDPVFCGYVDSLIDKYSESELASVWKSLIRKCLEGNVQALRLFFELKGKFDRNNQQDGGVQIIDDV